MAHTYCLSESSGVEWSRSPVEEEHCSRCVQCSQVFTWCTVRCSTCCVWCCNAWRVWRCRRSTTRRSGRRTWWTRCSRCCCPPTSTTTRTTRRATPATSSAPAPAPAPARNHSAPLHRYSSRWPLFCSNIALAIAVRELLRLRLRVYFVHSYSDATDVRDCTSDRNSTSIAFVRVWPPLHTQLLRILLAYNGPIRPCASVNWRSVLAR